MACSWQRIRDLKSTIVEVDWSKGREGVGLVRKGQFDLMTHMAKMKGAIVASNGGGACFRIDDAKLFEALSGTSNRTSTKTMICIVMIVFGVCFGITTSK